MRIVGVGSGEYQFFQRTVLQQRLTMFEQGMEWEMGSRLIL